MRARILAAAFLAIAHAAPSSGQSTWTDHGYLFVNGDAQLPSEFSGVAHPIAFAEPATIDTSYTPKVAPGLDAGASFRVWRSLGLGADVSFFTKTGTASVSAQVPHPFFFGRPRSVSGDAAGIDRSETAVHIQALWMLPAGALSRWHVGLFGGPSVFNVKQKVVTDITVAQTYPFDTATYSSSVAERRSKSRLGFNAGADLAYFVARRAGFGFTLTYSHARVPLVTSSSGTGDAVSFDAGGVRAGGGLRVRF